MDSFKTADESGPNPNAHNATGTSQTLRGQADRCAAVTELKQEIWHVEHNINEHNWTRLWTKHLIQRIEDQSVVELRLDSPPRSVVFRKRKTRSRGDEVVPKGDDDDTKDKHVSDGPQGTTTSGRSDEELWVETRIRKKMISQDIELDWLTVKALIEALTTDISSTTIESSDIAFHVFVPIHAFEANCSEKNPSNHFGSQYYEQRGDIRCGGWRTFDFTKLCSFQRGAATSHTEGDTVGGGTGFCSISTSPRRSYNYARTVSSPKIAIIDLRVLRRLGIPYGSTTEDLGLKCSYATRQHLLVKGWIPSRSIMGLLGYGVFLDLMHSCDISTEGSNASASSEYNKTLDIAALRTCLLKIAASDELRKQQALLDVTRKLTKVSL